MRAGTLLIAGAVTSAVTLLGAGTAAAAPANTIADDGLYMVGTDIVPGLWESAGPQDPAHGCDWRRLWKVEGDNTDMNAITASNYTKLAPIRVEIKATDVAFKTENCGQWRLVPRPSTGSFGG